MAGCFYMVHTGTKREGGSGLLSDLGERICLRCNTQALIIDMGIDLCGVQMIVPKNFMHSANIHTILQHQRSSGVAELVRGIFAAVDPGSGKALFYHGMNG